MPEAVRPHNYDKLKTCVQNGLHKYPGCSFIHTVDGKKIHVGDKISNSYVLKDGDIV